MISPSLIRIAISFILSGLIIYRGLKKKSLSISGAVAGVLIAISHGFVNSTLFLCLMTFYLSSSKLTKYKQQEKKRIECEFKEG
eukprot:Pgem_evm1s10680